jgi:sugar lactone lactonase YvrE
MSSPFIHVIMPPRSGRPGKMLKNNIPPVIGFRRLWNTLYRRGERNPPVPAFPLAARSRIPSPGRALILASTLRLIAVVLATAGCQVVDEVASDQQEIFATRQLHVRTVLGPTAGIGDALSIDRFGALYSSDFLGTGTIDNPNGDRVSRVNEDGSLPPFVTGIAGPAGAAFDSKGTFYVAAFLGGQVVRRTRDGAVTVFASGLEGPVGVAIDDCDRVYVSVAGLSGPGFRVYRFRPTGEREIFADLSQSGFMIFGLGGLAFDRVGRLYVSNFIDGRVVRVDRNGVMEQFAVIPDLVFPAIGYLSFAGDQLYATGIGDNQVYVIDRDGNVRVAAGTGAAAEVDGPADRAAFDGPNGIVTAGAGRALWVSDTNARTLRRIEGVGRGH